MKIAMKHSLPVAFGYIPLGMAFGILYSSQTDYHFLYAILMAVFVFSGTGQFMVVGMIAAHAGYFEIFLGTLLINLRHIFYSLYALPLYSPMPLWKRLYSMMTLTDETFSITSTLPNEMQKPRFLFRLNFINHCWWIVGCAAGSIIGYAANLHIKGLEFSLTSLFIVLLIEQYQKYRQFNSILIAICSAAITLFLFNGDNFLIVTLLLSVVFVFAKKLYESLSR